MKFKFAFAALLALYSGYWAIASLGASGSFSHAFNALIAISLAAWLGWLIRDCDKP